MDYLLSVACFSLYKCACVCVHVFIHAWMCVKQLAFPSLVGLWESLEVEAKTWLWGSKSQQPLLCGAHLLSDDDAPPSPSKHWTPHTLEFPLLSAGKLNCVGMLCASLSGTWIGSLVFHTKVSFRVRGQATKTASSGGLGPINIFVHKGLWQLNRLQGDPHCRCMPSQGTTALELK